MELLGKKALVTGVYGQDGSYLAELLARRSVEIHGVTRYYLTPLANRIRRHLKEKKVRVFEHKCDLANADNITELVRKLQPDLCFHMAASHFSSEKRLNLENVRPGSCYLDNLIPSIHIMDAAVRHKPEMRMVFAGSCLMYNTAQESPQTIQTSYSSNSIYGLAKISIAEAAAWYRARYGLHISTAILYNHESPRRSIDYFSKKVIEHIAQQLRGNSRFLVLRNLNSVRDWGYARDYCEAMVLMSLCDAPGEFIISSGEGHTISEFVERAFSAANIPNWKEHVSVEGSSEALPSEIAPLVGDPTDTQMLLNWRPSLSFDCLIRKLLNCELAGHLD